MPPQNIVPIKKVPRKILVQKNSNIPEENEGDLQFTQNNA